MSPSKVFLPASLFLVAAAGCQGRHTPPKPAWEALSDRYSASTELRPEDVKGGQSFALRSLALALKAGGSNAEFIDAYGLNRQLSVLAAASEGPTLNTLCSALGLKDKRVDKLADHQARLARAIIGPEKGVWSAGSFWMVWPIALTPEFVAEQSARTGTHLKRLGSAGLGATSELDEWVDIQSGGLYTQSGVKLDKSRPIVSFLTFGAEDAWTRPASSGASYPGSFTGSDGKTEGRFFTLEADESADLGFGQAASFSLAKGHQLLAFLPKDRTLAGAAEQLSALGLDGLLTKLDPGRKRVDLPVVYAKAPSLNDQLKAIGLESILDGPSDYRYMALELRPANIPDWQQLSGMGWNETGILRKSMPAGATDPPAGLPTAGSLVFNRPFLWMLFEPKTRTILALGAVKSLRDLRKVP